MRIIVRAYPSWAWRHLGFDLPDPRDHAAAVAALVELGAGTAVLVGLGWGYWVAVWTLWLLGSVREPRADEVVGWALALMSLMAALDFQRWR